jgi:hypothetical protein
MDFSLLFVLTALEIAVRFLRQPGLEVAAGME